ncbi:VCBS repeat-containing protein [Scatolibacter rhodanostii]|uniref:VCBS repeat-containing protein n=1 Tax=Scatolibacter rhodanostii TaxID=2014781 RepID=UPI000C073C0D|nr:VCBS repeat-containing protein [Scatolibacter rhodanostii]
MVKKLTRIGTVLLLLFLLSGCAVTGLDAQALMSPPNANADQQEVHHLLVGEKTEVSFVYPKNGEYRSAIIMQDFTGDGVDDALGFILLETGGAEVKFLSKNEEGVWKVIASFKNPATQVDRVCFGDLTGNGSADVIVGWGNTQNNMSASLSVYHYQQGSIKEMQTKNTYGGMTLTDFDDDGVMEIFAIQRAVPAAEDSQESLPAKAEWIQVRGEELVSVLSTEADSSVVKYSSIQFGKIAQNQSAVVLDGTKADSSMTTQIFYMGTGRRLMNVPKGVNDETTANPLYRPPGAGGTARDINHDGIIEFPIVSPLPALLESSSLDSTSFLVEWSKIDLETMSYKSIKRTLMNLAENYWFILPGNMVGRITAINDSKLKAVTYYAVTPGESEEKQALLGSPLFTIRVFTKSAWEQRGATGGYELLAEKNDYVYGISVLNTDGENLTAIKRIKKSFQIGE